MQAFIYRHLVPAQNLLVAVTGRERFRDPWKLLDQGPVRVPVGGTVSVHFSLPRGPLLEQVQLPCAIRRRESRCPKVSLAPDSATVAAAGRC